MENKKRYTDYFIEGCPICDKQIMGSSEARCRHNFAQHLALKHNVQYQKARKYKISPNGKRIVYACLITGLLIVTPATNWLTGFVWMWALSPLSFSKCVRHKLDVWKEKYQRWKLKK